MIFKNYQLQIANKLERANTRFAPTMARKPALDEGANLIQEFLEIITIPR